MPNAIPFAKGVLIFRILKTWGPIIAPNKPDKTTIIAVKDIIPRSEERRVGKEC